MIQMMMMALIRRRTCRMRRRIRCLRKLMTRKKKMRR